MTSTKEHKPVEAEKAEECGQIPERGKVSDGGEVVKDTEIVEGVEVGEASVVGEGSVKKTNEKTKIPPSIFEYFRTMKEEVDKKSVKLAENLEADDDSDSSSGSWSPAWNSPKPFAKSDDMYRKFPENESKTEDSSWDEEFFTFHRNGILRKPEPEKKKDGNA